MATRAQILLTSDCGPNGPNWSYKAICDTLKVSHVTVTRTRKAFVEGNLDIALRRRKTRRQYENKLDHEQEAHLVALARSKAPSGRDRWSLRLLRDKYIEMGFVNSISHETVRTTLKKMSLSLG